MTEVKWNIDLKCWDYVLSAEATSKIINAGIQHNILPSFLIVILQFESMWGNSDVGRIDNNLAGMTWYGSTLSDSGVLVSRGLPRAEGDYYIHYSSLDDFFKDWLYLFRKGFRYNVVGKQTFDECVRGLFISGGASANYAELYWEEYLNRMQQRKKQIEISTGDPNLFTKIDTIWKNGVKVSENDQGSSPNLDYGFYTVQAGDSLWAISNKFGISLDQLCSLNGITINSTIHPGDVLKISNINIVKPDEPTNNKKTYTVQSGDSLWKIANQFGISVDKLCTLNGLTTSSVIHPGQELIVVSIDSIPVENEQLIKHYTENGQFTANRELGIYNDYQLTGVRQATLFKDESVYYDSVYITTHYIWISYISYSGIRRFIAINTCSNGQPGVPFGKINK